MKRGGKKKKNLRLTGKRLRGFSERLRTVSGREGGHFIRCNGQENADYGKGKERLRWGRKRKRRSRQREEGGLSGEKELLGREESTPGGGERRRGASFLWEGKRKTDDGKGKAG